ncbi:dienelactone hydrolase [Aspergillus sclerotialis]|uniref:Dienelactone hydrolase n=1 Tax=Aspergillus sclerotialis TaxID=2070753 RepID=A0A3A2ZTR5_9EURO|nr:dienelactone hydrolase [Aspergillus sclerotialis]
MASVTINAPGASGFLYNSGSRTARVCITAETEDFDKETLRSWQDEGFDVIYIPYDVGDKEYSGRLKTVKEGLGVGENYAVIAFGEAASFCLDYYLKSTNSSRLCALIAYYPTNIPDTRSRFPHSLRVLVHLAGKNVDMTTTPTALGLQGKRRRQMKQINPGIGTGERLNIGYPAYTYEYVQPGFAEYDLDEYDKLAADISWTRSLDVLRKGFGKQVDLEKGWEEHQEGKFFSSDISSTMDPYVSHITPAATYAPTMSGGIGSHALRRFYEQHFLGTLPPSMRLRLVSRTVGADRVVDELYACFTHTQEIPWMLPGVPPTNRKVEIILVSIVSMKAGRLHSEHVYWDQASLLVQVGLLDPKLVPQGVQGVDRLPVVGRESARRILHEDPETEEVYHNKLIKRSRAKGKGKAKENGENKDSQSRYSVSMEEITDDAQG